MLPVDRDMKKDYPSEAHYVNNSMPFIENKG